MTPAEIAAFERHGGAEVAGVNVTTSDVRVCCSATCSECYHIIPSFARTPCKDVWALANFLLRNSVASKSVWTLVAWVQQTQCTT